MEFTQGPSITLTYEQVLELATQLSPEQQQELARELAQNRLKALVKEMRPKRPVPQKEVMKAAKEARKRVAARMRQHEKATGRR